jgi:hypothetical protein
MIAKFNTIDLNHPSFKHISSFDRFEYNKALLNGSAMIVEFVDDKGEFKCSGIFSADGESVHVAELGGKFVRVIEIIERFTIALAKALQVKKVSFYARRGGVRKIGENLGYSLDEFNNYIKVI